jgi:hypothetical protein
MLEDRRVPACTASFSSGVLSITGDITANFVQITDNGAGGVNFLCDGVPRNFTQVGQLRVQTSSGNDSVTYTLSGDLTRNSTVNVSLGTGDDQFFPTLVGDIGAGWTLYFDVDGAAGTDRIDASLRGDLLGGSIAFGGKLDFAADGGTGNDFLRVNATADVDIAVGAGLGINLKGGPAGNDTLLTSYRGELDGKLDVYLNGGTGNDSCTGDLRTDSNSTGQITADVKGRAGSDNLRLEVRRSGVNNTATADADIDGDLGTDRCRRTANVSSVRCETDLVVV